jgi:hypothetical protein
MSEKQAMAIALADEGCIWFGFAKEALVCAQFL